MSNQKLEENVSLFSSDTLIGFYLSKKKNYFQPSSCSFLHMFIYFCIYLFQ